ncbi:hypothetical protein EHQ13_04260 [Leptospira gomenensis]|uniref:Cyclase family protein n=1 Tax=Leptospira gomenensis TaxID=2484974 RepID=A0A5F1Y7I6_9LEPT|nr:cyclase family protein [Leptospira gomenensis]TGK30925.1 hypothetical protein EHQ17_14470 [Leptospira gomenensis]TGK45355.1 hypothetical protein EHQ07_10525 [Leptospira gomenensis]TGK66268.1 hypothetical protein EHQ13_04260 [Leptospira gomenensis]
MILLSYEIGKNTPVYGGSGFPEVTQGKCLDHGDSCNTLNLNFSNHTGTHIDCPFHFDPNGKRLTDYPAEFWFSTKVSLLDLDKKPEAGTLIGPEHIGTKANLLDPKTEILFLKTHWGDSRSSEEYWKNPPGIAPDMSDFLRNTFVNLRIFGFDLISLSSYTNREVGRTAHRKFLNRKDPILILEDVNFLNLGSDILKLQNVLIAPLWLEGADGSPCTVFGNVGL